MNAAILSVDVNDMTILPSSDTSLEETQSMVGVTLSNVATILRHNIHGEAEPDDPNVLDNYMTFPEMPDNINDHIPGIRAQLDNAADVSCTNKKKTSYMILLRSPTRTVRRFSLSLLTV